MRRWGTLIVALFAALGLGVGAWWFLVWEPQARQRAALETVDAFARAWEQAEWPALAARVRAPADPAVQGHRSLHDDLAPERLRVEPAAVSVGDERAHADLTVTVDLAGLDTWRYETTLELAWTDGLWEVVWTPETVHPDFVEGGGFVQEQTWGTRAAILDRTGTPLAGDADGVVVGIEPQRIAEEAEVVDALVTHAGASRGRVEALLARDDLVDDWFYPIIELPRTVFDEVDPELRPVPGVLFRAAVGRAEATGGFALHLLGRAEELDAEQAEELGRGYEEGDVAGTFGLEAAFDEQLAGRPEATVSVVGPDGEPRAVVHRVDGVEPEDLHTTLDRGVQQAAEEALGDVGEPAALVAVALPGLEVRAAVSRPAAGFNRAFAGRYPPGSTFKVVTTAALLSTGMTPDAALDCPAERTVGGRTFRNAGRRELGPLTLREAFAESCNTAYVGTVDGLEDALAEAARSFGFDDTEHDVGLAATGGSYPEPVDLVEVAAAALGQARVEASPLHMATVAGAAATGQWQPATLFPDGAAREARQTSDDPGVLRDLMTEVVASGTGTPAQVAGETIGGKTGSAEFGTEDPPETHAWFIGYRLDADGEADAPPTGLAFAVLVEGGGAGGDVAGPIAARFVGALQ